MQVSNKSKSKRLTRADWQALSDEWKASDMKQQRFCKVKGISFNTFSYWHSRLGREAKQATPFQAVQIKASAPPLSAKQPINLKLPNGVSLAIPPTADKASLKNLFELLGITPC